MYFMHRCLINPLIGKSGCHCDLALPVISVLVKSNEDTTIDILEPCSYPLLIAPVRLEHLL